jgi:hypothetical protein
MDHKNIPEEFPVAAVKKSFPPVCVDGRRDSHHNHGAKMLGGSLHIVLLWCLWHGKPFNERSCEEVFGLLKKAGFGLGVHRGSHKNANQHLSDCGFADNLASIIEVALVDSEEIKAAVKQLFKKHAPEELQLRNSFSSDITEVWKKCTQYPRGSIMIWGEDAIQAAEKAGARVSEVEGEHMEETAFVNLELDKTLDAEKEYRSGHQAFDLDLWMVMEQAKTVGLPHDFALMASLILYVATEIILVERKGKHSLPIEVIE